MIRFNNLILLFAIYLIGCSSKVVVSDIDRVEKVDLNNISPFSLFYSQKDSIELEYFKKYEKDVFEISTIHKAKELNNIKFFVQVGFSDNYDEIQLLKKQVQSLFPTELCEIKYIPPYYRIIIGPLSTKSKADEIFSILENKKYPSLKIITEKIN